LSFVEVEALRNNCLLQIYSLSFLYLFHYILYYTHTHTHGFAIFVVILHIGVMISYQISLLSAEDCGKGNVLIVFSSVEALRNNCLLQIYSLSFIYHFHHILYYTNTHTHTHTWFCYLCGDSSYRRNDFYTEQTVYFIPLH